LHRAVTGTRKTTITGKTERVRPIKNKSEIFIT